MAAKIGKPDRQGIRRSVASLSNKEIIDKGRFKPKEWNKIQSELRIRGLSWSES